MREDPSLGNRIGFYVASIGTAFGLGNLWRFPYVTVEYGGGAFVFLYILLAFFIGIPLVIAEVSLGKILHKKGVPLQELVCSLSRGPRSMYFVLTWVPAIMAFFVLAYCAILSGWTLHLISRNVFALITERAFSGDLSFVRLKANVSMQMLLASAHLIIVFGIAQRGFRAGIEKWMLFVMPFFVVLLVATAARILTVPDLFESLRYMIYPNFHLLRPASLSFALGHVLFTLSVGFGTLVAIGGYLPIKSSSGSAGVRLTSIDTLISVFIGILVFPVISSYEVPMSEALFRSVPLFFQEQGVPMVYQIGFFLCVFIASINASIGLVETLFWKFEESFKWSRGKSSQVLYFCVLAASSLILIGSRFFASAGQGVREIIEVVDDVSINHILPLAAFGLSFIALKCIDEPFLKGEFHVSERKENINIYRVWRALLLFFVPIIYLAGLALRYLL